MTNPHVATTISGAKPWVFVASTLFLVVLLDDRCRSDEKVDVAVIKPAIVEAKPLVVNNNWAVWRTTELIERARFFRGPLFTHRFYRQKLDEAEARFAFRIATNGAPRSAALTAPTVPHSGHRSSSSPTSKYPHHGHRGSSMRDGAAASRCPESPFGFDATITPRVYNDFLFAAHRREVLTIAPYRTRTAP